MTEPVEPVIQPTPTVIQAISEHLGPEIPLTAEQIGLVLGAWNDIQQGAPLGTIMRNPETGAIAHRVSQDGRHVWRVSSPDGDQWIDLQPILQGWEPLGT